jgi:hypothetical protein
MNLIAMLYSSSDEQVLHSFTSRIPTDDLMSYEQGLSMDAVLARELP